MEEKRKVDSDILSPEPVQKKNKVLSSKTQSHRVGVAEILTDGIETERMVIKEGDLTEISEEDLQTFRIWYDKVCVFGIYPTFVCNLWYFVHSGDHK